MQSHPVKPWENNIQQLHRRGDPAGHSNTPWQQQRWPQGSAYSWGLSSLTSREVRMFMMFLGSRGGKCVETIHEFPLQYGPRLCYRHLGP